MAAEALIETGITIAARVLLASFEALAQKAKADEAAELTRMLGETKARLAAMPPIAESLDAIRDVHLERLRTEGLVKRWGPAMEGLAKGPGAPADQPAEGIDPDDT